MQNNSKRIFRRLRKEIFWCIYSQVDWQPYSRDSPISRDVWTSLILCFPLVLCGTVFIQNKMAPLRVGRVYKLRCWTEGDVCRFLLWSLYLFYQQPWLLFGLVLKDCFPMILKQTRIYTGSSAPINSRNPCSLIEKDSSDASSASKEPSEAYPKSFACTSADREIKKPGNSESFKTSENSKFESIFDVDQLPNESNKNDRLESLEECPSLGIQNIESLLQMANYDGGNLSIADDGAKKTNALFPDAGGYLYGHENYI